MAVLLNDHSLAAFIKLKHRYFEYKIVPVNRATPPQRSGQALIEFGIIALALYMVVGAAITFGLWIFAAGQIQQAANVGARELSQTPLAFDATFEEALDDPVVRQRVFDDRWLVIDIGTLEEENPGFNFFTDVVPQMPLLNQQLASLYIVDNFDDDNDSNTADLRLLRYPGAILSRDNPVTDPPLDDKAYVAQQFVVRIPIVVERQQGGSGGGGGSEQIRWVDVVEEIDDDGEDGDNPDPFSLVNNQDADADFDNAGGDSGDVDDAVQRGVVALRVHYPAQSTWLSSFQNRGNFIPNVGDPNAADDDGVAVINPDDQRGGLITRPLTTTNSLGDDVLTGTYGGTFGLGVHGALTNPPLTGDAVGIRPYRRVLVSHAIFRREAFTNNTTPIEQP